jgi:hypothetical protein
MGQAKSRGTFEERKAAAIIVNDEKQRLEIVKNILRAKKRRRRLGSYGVTANCPFTVPLMLSLGMFDNEK